MTRIAVLGLGEAGTIFATDLAARTEVVGYDPAWRGDAAVFRVAASGAEAVRGADVVIALTAGADAPTALHQVAAAVPSGALYADMSTASPAQKRALARAAETAGFEYADVALLAPVPRQRLATPAQASGPGAAAAARLLGELGASIRDIGPTAGDASARKLLRSIVVKGLTALMVEGLRAADELGQLDWYSEHVAETLTGFDTAFLARMLDGTTAHSTRRVHEMAAAAEMVEAAGVDAVMTRATARVLATAQHGIPRDAPLR